MSTAPFSKIQPRDGDTVMVCQHLAMDSAPFERKEGKFPESAYFFAISGVANFFVALCDDCFAKQSSFTPQQLIQVAKYVTTWKGDAPIIREARA